MIDTDRLERIGWSARLEQHIEDDEGYVPARVLVQHKGSYVVTSAQGEFKAELAGKLRHEARGANDLPVVGDWVAVAPRPDEGSATIHRVLPRSTKFSRKSAGDETEEQVLAANIDSIFIVTSLNSEMNLRRLERYLTLAWESGAAPVVVLTKKDLAPEDVEEVLEKVGSAAVGVPIHAVSGVTGEGIEELRSYFTDGATVALLGSSGVGKSTLANALLGSEVQKVSDIRKDDKGRHTTTHRELVELPDGGALIDTPGMRELQLWDASGGISNSFEDIETLATDCRFRDCRHDQEPGCAVAAALLDGRLDRGRFESYEKLQRELLYLERKQDVRARSEEQRKWKIISKDQRRYYKPRSDRG